MLEALQRHDLLRVHPDAWTSMLRERQDLAPLQRVVAGWAARRWPVIVCRRQANDPPGTVPAAFCLPPSRGEGKRRIRVQLPAQAVCERIAPCTLRAARDLAPPSWRPAIRALLELAAQVGAEPCVFGSLLWQSLTGLPYLTSASDLDLLWRVPEPAATGITQLVHHLARIEASGPVRLDGEIILADGEAVNWRELRTGAAEVLVKTRAGVEIRAAAALFPALELVS